MNSDPKIDQIYSNSTAWLVCLSAGLFFFYQFFQLNIFDVINQPLRQDFQLDAAQLSWMSSTYLWADILFLLPAGFLLDRYSTRAIIFMSMGLCIVATISFAFASSFAMASIFHFLAGIGNAFCFLCCVVLISHWFPPRQQGFVIGLVVTMAFMGGMMAHTPFAHLNEQYGWRTSLLIDGIVGVFFLIWMYFIIHEKPEKREERKQNSNTNGLSNILQALLNKQNWLSGIYTAFLNLPIMVLCALWGASYLQQVHQLSELASSNIVSLIYVGSIIGCPLAGWLSDKFGRRKPLMFLGAIASLLTLIPFFMNVELSSLSLSILFFLLGLFTSTQVITYPLVTESNPSQNTGAATAIASTIIMGGGALGQILFGFLMRYHTGNLFQQYQIQDYQFAMWIFPITILLALVTLYFTKETYCQVGHPHNDAK